MVITMKSSNDKQNKTNNYLLNRMQRKTEIRRKMIDFLMLHENQAIVDVQKNIGMNRSTLNYWIKEFESEGWIRKERQKDIQGRPTFLKLNKSKINEAEKRSYKHWKSFEEFTLKNILVNKLIDEIEEQPDSHKQLQEIMRLFKEDGSYASKLIFLLYENFVKINYELSLTDEGRKYLKRKKIRIKPSLALI